PLFQVCGAAAGLPSGLCEIQGTSYASPQIAAGLALLMEAAPGLTPQQIVDLAFTSAVDRGAAGTDSVFGRGQFDIARAFAPVGPLAFETASGAAAPADAPVGTVGAAYGDAFANTEAWRATAFDSFDRSFDVSLAHGWIGAAQASIADQAAPALWRQGETHGALSAHFTTPDDVGPDAVRRRMLEEPEGAFRAFAALSDDVTLTVARNAQALDFDLDAAATGHLGFAGAEFAVAIERQLGGGALTFASQTGEADLGLFGPSRRRGWAMRYADALGPVRFDATYGVLTEEGALLGLVWDDAWGAAANGITEFIGLGANWSPRPDWETSASIEFGRARLDGGSWLTLDAPLLTSAARAAVRWRVTPSLLAEEGIGGAWTLSVSQPLRIESGAFSALLPVSDAWGRQHLAFDRRSIGASPSGREIETRLSYWLWSGGVLSAHADLAHRSEPGHRADADDAVEALIGLRLAH
ncbi:MAG: S8 family serine peptidase, partial [Hyphomonadaceae bacterium]